MEDAMMNEESNLSAPGSVSVTSTEDTAPEETMQTPKSKRNTFILMDVKHLAVNPSDVIEYEWPQKSGDKWFLQEQIGDLLDIKSFSRKYTDLVRRKLSYDEREFLTYQYSVDKLLNETQLRDLTAMRSVEVINLMDSEYPHIYQEYKKAVSAREKKIAMEKAKEMEAIKNDAGKLAELRKNAIKSAMEFNKDLQTARKTERKHFWDIQTNIIQSRTTQWKKLKAEYTRPDPYPVALVPGQFQNYYKRFTKQEMLRMPLNSVLDGEFLFPTYRDSSPPPAIVTDEERSQLEDTDTKHDVQKLIKLENGSISIDKCDMCETTGGAMIKCNRCHVSSHISCLEMSNEMIEAVKAYEWNCVDCRLCTICEQPDGEESMMFCDRCDRGYHTYCVGVRTAPKGTWYCEQFCAEKAAARLQRTPVAVKSGRRSSKR